MKSLKELMAELANGGYHNPVVYAGTLLPWGGRAPRYLGYRERTGAVALWGQVPTSVPRDAIVLEVAIESVQEGVTVLAMRPQPTAASGQPPIYPRMEAVRRALGAWPT